MVDSVPELVKRHAGSPQRRRSSSATTIEPSVGAAKCVPSAIRAFTAAAMTGFACPTHITPNPLWKSVYWLPSTSQTYAPEPCDEVRRPRVGLLELGRNAAGHDGRGAREVLTRPGGALTQPARSRSIRSAYADAGMCGDAGNIADMGRASVLPAKAEPGTDIPPMRVVDHRGGVRRDRGGDRAATRARRVLIDRAPDVGGTWLLNDYPGAACDVPSHLYSFSFEQRRHWPRLCSPRDEILGYMRERRARVRHRPLAPNTEIATRATTTTAGRSPPPTAARSSADALIVATGQLHRTHTPKLPGDASRATASTPPSGTTTTT